MPATNREGIILDARATLAAVVAGQGSPPYALSIVTVGGKFKAYNEYAQSELPAVCVFAAKRGKPPLYYPGGQVEKSLILAVIGHVSTVLGDEDDRTEQISALEDIVRRALAVDPMRGGWAIDTIQIEDWETDEAIDDELGKDFGTASAQWFFECTYYPND